MEGRKEREGFLLLLHDFILCDYYRPEHLLFLYVGIPAPGKVYSSGADSFYVSGYGRGWENLRIGGGFKCKDWEMDLLRGYGICNGSFRV